MNLAVSVVKRASSSLVKYKMVNQKVSICLTTYNRSELLEKSINNILNQSYSNFELFVIDDFSEPKHRDKNLSLSKLITDPRVTYIFNHKNCGLAHNRNQAINNAVGHYFTFKDDDDQWELDFLLEMVQTAALSNSSPDIVLTGYNSINRNISFKFKEQKLSLYECFLLGYTPPVGGQFYKLSLLKSVNGYNDVKTGVDHDLWINIVAKKEDAEVVFVTSSLVTPDAYALPGSEKMTTNFNKRVIGVNTSLAVWREKLVTTFGVAFYKHFSRQYNFYLCQRFLTFCIKFLGLNICFPIH